MRRFFIEAWRKARTGDPLEPLERQIADIVQAHPEYHGLLEAGEAAEGSEFPPESGQTNPFLHLSLHLAVLEQIGTDRPPGLRAIYQRLTAAVIDRHATEHHMMECLAQSLREAQRTGRPPDEADYLTRLRRLILRTGR
jgi:hypothetical protein